jgi:hypothetical protein
MLDRRAVYEFSYATLTDNIEQQLLLDARDSQLVASTELTYADLREQGRQRVLRTSLHNNWDRTANYLWTDAAQARKMAGKFGFTNAYYFANFLSSYDKPNRCREELLETLRDKTFATTQDSAIYSLSDRRLLGESFRVRVRGMLDHEH